jgi:hypothetical protein
MEPLACWFEREKVHPAWELARRLPRSETDDIVYHSQTVRISRSSVEINGHPFALSTIKEISFFDEQQQAYRWVKVAGTILLVAMGLSFLTGETWRVGLVVVLGTILGLLFVVGYTLFPTAGAGLVIEFLNGSSEIFGGLPRKELPIIRDTITAIIKPYGEHSEGTTIE